VPTPCEAEEEPEAVVAEEEPEGEAELSLDEECAAVPMDVSDDLLVARDDGMNRVLEADEAMGSDDDGAGEQFIVWIAVYLAALLPQLADALPRDHGGVCIIPHPHEMEKQEASECSGGNGRTYYSTNKICDNCGARIRDKHFYHCSENCDIDFCQECQRSSQKLLGKFLARSGDEDSAAMSRRLFWVVDITERIGFYVLRRGVEQRARLAHELAFEWPKVMFEQLIQAAVDVVNAKVVHVQDVKDVTSDSRFWYSVGWLQFLYSANALVCGTLRLDEQASRGPKVEYERFILEGINKCEPLSEFKRWQKHPSAKVPDMLSVGKFRLTRDFCSFLTHSNLVPVSFRRVCLLCEIWEHIQQEAERNRPAGLERVQPLHLEVPRDPQVLLEVLLATFDGLTDAQLRRPLRVTFAGEEAIGPGVTKEFFKVAFRSFLNSSAGAAGESAEVGCKGVKMFSCNDHRTYWFDEDATNADAFRACGILLGQAVLNNVFVPNIFPRVLYARLLHDLDSPCSGPLCLEDLASVEPEVAKTMRRLLDHVGDDIAELFGDMGWARTGRIPEDCQLTQANKQSCVQAYIDWFFRERVARQLEPLSAGFRAVLGGSVLLRSIVDAVQLEKIVCGGAVPVDAAAMRRGATHEGWTEEELAEYLPMFWDVLMGLSEVEKVQFVVFVTASDRVPLRGWQDLGLIVYKDGVGDERLPRAYTCFSQLLLPRYSDRETLRKCLLLAVANSEGFGLR